MARAALSLRNEPGKILCVQPNHTDGKLRHNGSIVDMRSFVSWLESRDAVFPSEMRTAYLVTLDADLGAALTDDSVSTTSSRIEKSADGRKAATMRKILLFLLHRIDPMLLSSDYRDWDDFVKSLHKAGNCLGPEVQVDLGTFTNHLDKARSIMLAAK